MTYRTSRRLRLVASLGAASLFSAAVFAYASRNGLVNLLVDAQSHWLHVFLTVRSLTPGISQIGFWPPFLHVVLVPAALAMPVPILKGAGAFATLLPLLLASAYFLWDILRRFRAGPAVSALGATLLVVHPFVEYFTTSAMTEIPLIFCVLGTARYALKWRNGNMLFDLSMIGVFSSLTVTARYEGALIAPFALLFVVCDRLEKKVPFQQMKAELSIFVFMAALGPLAVMVYSYAYSGSPLGFLNLGSDRIFAAAAFSRRKMTLAGTEESLRMFYHASVHMHGAFAVLAFPVAALAVLWKRAWDEILVLLMLLTPGLFVLLMMIVGRNYISVAELPPFRTGGTEPYGLFANTRYALTWVGGLCFALALAVRNFSPWTSRMGKAWKALLVAAVAVPSIAWFGWVAFVSDFSTIRLDETASEWRPPFIQEYDGGRVLMTRDYNVPELFFAGIPADMLIVETNYRYFAQALKEPWLFARWVVVRRKIPNGDANSFRALRQLMERESNPVFLTYYKLVQDAPSVGVYRLNDGAVYRSAVSLGYDPLKIPSLNPGAPWDPVTVYRDIKAD